MLIRRVSLVLLATTAAMACATSTEKGGGGTSESNTTSGGNSGGGNATGGGGTGGTSDSSSATGSTTGGSGSNGGSGSGSNTSSGSASNGSGSGSGTSTTVASSSGSSAETLPGPTFVTSAQGSYWVTGTTATVTSGTATLTVNDSTTYQTFNGFGGAFNEKGWSVLQMLSASDRAKALTLLFDWTNGAHFVYGRIPIGASDYALSRYTDDDTANDYTMTDFSISRDEENLIPYVQAALAINPNIQLWASPWTPPAWMKENGNSSASDGQPDDGGNMSTSTQVLQAFALYEAKWVQAYAGQGITISQLMPQNEPNYGETYPSCLWTPTLYDQFVSQYLGPEFATENLSTQIYLGTMSCQSLTCTTGDSFTDDNVLMTVTADSTAMKYIKGFALQWNVIDDISAQTHFDLPIWQTEHRAGNYPWGGETTIVNVGTAPANITFNSTTAPNDFNYALESFGLIGQWLEGDDMGTNGLGVNSYSAWNMVLDTGGLSLDTTRIWPQNALLTVDTSTATLNITPAYYVFRHFSQFVAPGAVRVATSGSSSFVSYAFKNTDGSHALIMYNPSTSSVETTASVGGKLIQFTVPANAFATLKT